MEKKCKVCGTIKTIDLFYKKDNTCKECRKEKARRHRAENIDKVRAYDRKRGQTEARKKKNKDYQNKMKSEQPDKWRAMRQRACSKYRATNRNKASAVQKLERAVSLGEIKKQPCAICGNLKAEAHHPDYSKPLDVIWLCDYHHKEEHKKLREEQRKSST